MFTLGDVADILDSALDTGISIVDALAKLSDLADEGGLVNAKGFKFEEGEEKVYDENGNLISRSDNGSIYNENSEENISNIVLSDDSGVCSGSSINFNNKTLETSTLLLDCGPGSGKKLLPYNNTVPTNGDSTTDNVNCKGSINLFSDNKDHVNVQSVSANCKHTSSIGLDHRSTYVLESANTRNSGNKLFEKNPVFEAFGNLCHIADDVLKYRKDDYINKCSTGSNPDSLNAKVNNMLDSFQKLDETVEKLKLQAMQNHLVNHPEDEVILTTHRFAGNHNGLNDIFPCSDPGTPVMSRRHSSDNRPQTANGIDSSYSLNNVNNCKGYSISHVKDSKQFNNFQDAEPSSLLRQAEIRKGSKGILPSSDPDKPVISRKRSSDNSPQTTSDVDHSSINNVNNCPGYSIKHLKDFKQGNTVTPFSSRNGGTRRGSKDMPYSDPGTPVMLRKRSRDKRPRTYLLSNADSSSISNESNYKDMNEFFKGSEQLGSFEDIKHSLSSFTNNIDNGLGFDNEHFIKDEGQFCNFGDVKPSLARQVSQETYILDDETEFLEETQDSNKIQNHRETYTLLNSNDNLKQVNTSQNGFCVRKISPTSNKCTYKHKDIPLSALNIGQSGKSTLTGNSSFFYTGNSEHKQKDVLLRKDGNTFERNSNSRQTYILNNEPLQTTNSEQMTTRKDPLDIKKPSPLPRNGEVKKGTLQTSIAPRSETDCKKQIPPARKGEVKRNPLPLHNDHRTEALHSKKLSTSPNNGKVKKSPLQTPNDKQMTTSMETCESKKQKQIPLLRKGDVSKKDHHNGNRQTYILCEPHQSKDGNNNNNNNSNNIQNNFSLKDDKKIDQEKNLSIDGNNKIVQNDQLKFNDISSEIDMTRNNNICTNVSTFTRSDARSTYILGSTDNTPNKQKTKNLAKEVNSVNKINNKSRNNGDLDEKTLKTSDNLCGNMNNKTEREKHECKKDTATPKATNKLSGKGLVPGESNQSDQRGTYVLFDPSKKKTNKNKPTPVKQINSEFLKNVNSDKNKEDVMFFITTKPKTKDTAEQVFTDTIQVRRVDKHETKGGDIQLSNGENIDISFSTNDNTSKVIKLAPQNVNKGNCFKKDLTKKEVSDQAQDVNKNEYCNLIYEVNSNLADTQNANNIKYDEPNNTLETSVTTGNEQRNGELCNEFELMYEIAVPTNKNSESMSNNSFMKHSVENNNNNNNNNNEPITNSQSQEEINRCPSDVAFSDVNGKSCNNNTSKESTFVRGKNIKCDQIETECMGEIESSNTSISEPISISKHSRAGSLGSLIENNSFNFSSQQVYMRSCSDPSSSSEIKCFYNPRRDLFRKLGTLQNLMSSSLTKLDTLNYWHKKNFLSKDSPSGSSCNSSVFGPQEHIDKLTNRSFSLDQSLASLDELSTRCTIIEKDTMVVLIDENCEEVDDRKCSTPNFPPENYSHFNDCRDTCSESIENVSYEDDDIPCTYTIASDASSIEDISPLEDEWQGNININCPFNESLINNKDFLANGEIFLPLPNICITNDDMSLTGENMSSSGTSPVSRSDTFVLTPTSEEEKDLLLGHSISDITASCHVGNEYEDHEQSANGSNQNHLMETVFSSNNVPKIVPRLLDKSKTDSTDTFIHPNSLGHIEQSIPQSLLTTKRRNDNDKKCTSNGHGKFSDVKAKGEHICFYNTISSKNNSGKERETAKTEKNIRRKETYTKTHSNYNTKRGQRNPIHTNYLKRRHSNVKLQNEENEEETLTIQLAALRSQLEEKRKKFNKEKRKQQQQFKERAQNLHNGFFITLKNEEQKQDHPSTRNKKHENWKDFTSGQPCVNLQDNPASGSNSSDTLEDTRIEDVKKEGDEKETFQCIELGSKELLFSNATEEGNETNQVLGNTEFITTTPEEDIVMVTSKKNQCLQPAETSRKETNFDTSVLKLDEFDISLSSSIQEPFSEPNDSVLIPISYTTPDSTPPMYQDLMIDQDESSTPSTPTSDSTYILAEPEHIQIDFADLDENVQEPILSGYIEDRHEVDNTIDSTLEQVSSSLMDLLNYVENLPMNEIPIVENIIMYCEDSQVSQNEKVPIVTSGNSNFDEQLVEMETNLDNNITNKEQQETGNNTPNVASHGDIEKTPMAFSVGMDLVECPELTPQQKRKRERFLRQRQKSIVEEKGKKAEVENSPETPSIPSRKVKREVLTTRTPRTQQHTPNSTSYSPDEACRYADYTGPDTYKKPTGKSNRKLIQNAMTHCCLCGVVNKEARTKCFNAMEKSEANHFLVLFREGLKFRSVYEYHPGNDAVTRVYGIGPKTINEKMISKYFKYDSGGKEFSLLETKHLSIQVDGLLIKKELWEKKQTSTSKLESSSKKYAGNTQKQGY